MICFVPALRPFSFGRLVVVDSELPMLTAEGEANEDVGFE